MIFRNEWEQKHSRRDHELYSLHLSVLFSLLKMLLFQKYIPKKKYYCWIWEFFSTLTQCWREWRNAELLFAASSSNHTHWSSRFSVLKLYNEGLSFFSFFLLSIHLSFFFSFPFLSWTPSIYFLVDLKNKCAVCLNFLLMVEQIFLNFKNQVEVIFIGPTRTSLYRKNMNRTSSSLPFQ